MYFSRITNILQTTSWWNRIKLRQRRHLFPGVASLLIHSVASFSSSCSRGVARTSTFVTNHRHHHHRRGKDSVRSVSPWPVATRSWPSTEKIQKSQCVRFGSRAGVVGNPPGTISIFDEQETLSDMNIEALRQTIRRISRLVGYETYDVTLLLVDDEEMQDANLESRNVDAPTDILSFPFIPHETPGTLMDPPFDIPDYYTLGDMMVDVPYVMRRCQEDQEDFDKKEEFDQEEEEDDEEEDRGVSGAMATVFDPEKRIHMLMVHGMLHLVGYDHEDDEDYELMVTKEEEILKELNLIPVLEDDTNKSH